MYDILKGFHQQIKNAEQGEGCLSSKYIEELCRTVFNFNSRRNKSHDAVDNN